MTGLDRRLVITKGGTYSNDMIHRADCHMAQRGAATPWEWANTVSMDEVRHAVRRNRYRTCSRCQPVPAGIPAGVLAKAGKR